jgi:hypothetical protein
MGEGWVEERVERLGGERSQMLQCTIYDLSLYIAVTLDLCMMEFFSSYERVNDRLGYLSFVSMSHAQYISEGFQSCHSLVALTGHWYITSSFPRTLLSVSFPSIRSHLYARTSLQPSTQGRNAAHPKSPTVAPINTNTTAWSLAESL